jgi:hypothetical protein
MPAYHGALTPYKGDPADRPRRVLPLIIRRLSRRYGLPYETATIVATAAGFVLEGRQ